MSGAAQQELVYFSRRGEIERGKGRELWTACYDGRKLPEGTKENNGGSRGKTAWLTVAIVLYHRCTIPNDNTYSKCVLIVPHRLTLTWSVCLLLLWKADWFREHVAFSDDNEFEKLWFSPDFSSSATNRLNQQVQPFASWMDSHIQGVQTNECEQWCRRFPFWS